MKINQRKENEIYCSNCGEIIAIESKFCPSCGVKQKEINVNSNNINRDNKNLIDPHKLLSNESRNTKKIKNQIVTDIIVFLCLMILLSVIIKLAYVNNQDKLSSASKRNYKKNSAFDVNNCVGVGNQSCIDKVRQNFTNTGKTILGEQYLGDGRFGISFMDRQYPGAYNATVSTDCNCNVTNSNVTTVR